MRMRFLVDLLLMTMLAVPSIYAQTHAAASANPLLGKNLIRNGDAEQETNTMWAPGWQPAQLLQEAGYGRIAGEWEEGVQGAPHGGCCYLRLEWQEDAANTGNSSRSAFQEIDLTALANDIDHGMVWAKLSAYLGGLIEGNTQTSLTASWQDANGKELGNTALSPVFTSSIRKPFIGIASLVPREQMALVPAGTRKAAVTFAGKATAKGFSYTALGDNLSLVLTEEGIRD